jgi:hypothetical protein
MGNPTRGSVSSPPGILIRVKKILNPYVVARLAPKFIKFMDANVFVVKFICNSTNVAVSKAMYVVYVFGCKDGTRQSSIPCVVRRQVGRICPLFLMAGGSIHYE